MKVLLVEDEIDIAVPINRFFSSLGWKCSVAKNLNTAIELLEEETFDICILDLFLGREKGSELIPILNDKGIPVIVLTVVDDVSEKVKCLKMGADDYLVKPFSFEELLARIEAVLRRLKGTNKKNSLVYENLEIDLLSMIVSIDGEVLPLPKKQVMILIKLIENIGRITPYEKLLSYAWSSYEDATIESLRTHVHYLRKALRKYGFDIISYVGIGYALKHEKTTKFS